MSEVRSERPMMTCGCAANATDGDGHPACAIHGTITAAPPPTLTGRTALCPDCDKKVPSDMRLPFFQFRGEGSSAAVDQCKCGYYEIAHQEGRTRAGHPFEPHGAWDYDLYYCGCRGWN